MSALALIAVSGLALGGAILIERHTRPLREMVIVGPGSRPGDWIILPAGARYAPILDEQDDCMGQDRPAPSEHAPNTPGYFAERGLI